MTLPCLLASSPGCPHLCCRRGCEGRPRSLRGGCGGRGADRDKTKLSLSEADHIKIWLHLSVSWEVVQTKLTRAPRCQSGFVARLGSLSAALPHAPQVTGLLMPCPWPHSTAPSPSGQCSSLPSLGEQVTNQAQAHPCRSHCFLVLAGSF